MNTITLSILGREILAIHVSEPAQIAPEPIEEEPLAVPDGFGFHGGSGGQATAAWSPSTPRPIDGR